LPFSAVKMRTDDLAGSNRALGVWPQSLDLRASVMSMCLTEWWLITCLIALGVYRRVTCDPKAAARVSLLRTQGRCWVVTTQVTNIVCPPLCIDLVVWPQVPFRARGSPALSLFLRSGIHVSWNSSMVTPPNLFGMAIVVFQPWINRDSSPGRTLACRLPVNHSTCFHGWCSLSC
jgi:hypothetical protein